MATSNISDIIEQYLKGILKEAECIEIKRRDLAENFKVVPSQINYVIKTRFTKNRGYLVESKRGGGGYIRIAKINFSTNHELLIDLSHNIGQTISEQVFADIINLLLDEQIITKREWRMIVTMASDATLGIDGPTIRSQMLKKLLQELDIKGEK